MHTQKVYQCWLSAGNLRGGEDNRSLFLNAIDYCSYCSRHFRGANASWGGSPRNRKLECLFSKGCRVLQGILQGQQSRSDYSNLGQTKNIVIYGQSLAQTNNFQIVVHFQMVGPILHSSHWSCSRRTIIYHPIKTLLITRNRSTARKCKQVRD